MYTGTSESFNAALQNTYHYRKFKAMLKYKDTSGVEVIEEITQDAVVSGSCKLTASCLNSNDFNVGSVIAQDFQITLYNHDKKYNGCKFQNGTIEPYFGLVTDSGDTEWCPLGLFYIDEAGKTYNKTIQLKAVDILLKFEKIIALVEYEGTTTLKTLFEKLCDNLGMAYNSNFSNSDFTFNEFQNRTLTYRDILGYIAAAAGGFVRVNKSNQIEIVEFEINKNQYITIDPNSTRIECDVDEAITIDSVAYYVKEGENKLIGDGKYALTIENNELFDALNDLNGLLSALYTKYNGFTYYPVTIEYVGDPRIEPGDTVFLPKTAEGDIYTFIDKHILTISSFSSLTTPVCNELEKGFLDDYKNYQTPATGGGGTAAPVVNPNLLLISKFTKAFLPYNFVGKWAYTNRSTYGVECLDTYLMNEAFSKVWLPFVGDIKAGQTYTLSIYAKSRDQRYTPKYKLCLVPSFTTNESGNIVLNDIADKSKAPVQQDGTTEILGEITLSSGWDWHTITFTAPLSLPYQTDLTGDLVGNRGYMLALYAEQLTYGTDEHTNYCMHIHKAKLEEGSEATTWCLSEAEDAILHESTDDNGRTTNTISSLVRSMIAVYADHKLEIGATEISWNEAKKIMMKRQKRVGTYMVNQILFGANNIDAANATMTPTAFTSIYTSEDGKSLYVNTPGGFYLNGTLQE